MNRFFAAPEEIRGETLVMTQKENLHHLRNVLRLKTGDQVEISDGVAWEYLGTIRTLEKEKAILDLTGKQPFAREPEIRITLFQGIPKQGKLETIIQKSVELGVSAIVPVFMERTQGGPGENRDKKWARCRMISKEAAAQSKRGIVPFVADALKFPEMVSRFASFDAVLFLYEEERQTTLKKALRQMPEGAVSIGLIVGPEGGFSPEEAKILMSSAAVSASLGKTVLRVETAGPAALAMCMYELTL